MEYRPASKAAVAEAVPARLPRRPLNNASRSTAWKIKGAAALGCRTK